MGGERTVRTLLEQPILHDVLPVTISDDAGASNSNWFLLGSLEDLHEVEHENQCSTQVE